MVQICYCLVSFLAEMQICFNRVVLINLQCVQSIERILIVSKFKDYRSCIFPR